MIFDLFGKKKKEEKPVEGVKAPAPRLHHYGSLDYADNGVKKLRPYPRFVRGARVRYYYDLPIVPLGIDHIGDILKGEEKIVDVKADGSDILISFEGDVFAKIENNESKAKMLADWEKKDDPANAVLKADGKTVNLRFYKDLRKYIGDREQTVEKLTNYKKKDFQEAIIYLKEGEEVGLVEEGQDVFVSTDNGYIGKLSRSVAEKVKNDGVFATYVEEIEETITEDGDSTLAPSVRIVW